MNEFIENGDMIFDNIDYEKIDFKKISELNKPLRKYYGILKRKYIELETS